MISWHNQLIPRLPLIVLLIFLAGCGGSAEDKIYSNTEHAYQISYPKDWNLEVGVTTCQVPDFCQQSTTLKSEDKGEVYVVVNFQGGWCEGVQDVHVREIEVGSHSAKEYSCPGWTIRSFGEGNSIIRFFSDDASKENYFILGQAHGDMGSVTSVVRSFVLTK